MKRPIFYDTETTGIRSDKDRIIEIAAFDLLQNRTFIQFVNPGIPIPKEATAIHHITDEMVKESSSWKEIGPAFSEFCGTEGVLIAHNNDAFDQPFLEEEFKRHGLEMPKWTFIDSLKWARKYRNDLPRHTLQSLREVYQIPANQAHRALDDVMVLSQVFSLMTDDLKIDQVIELLAVPSKINRMPFGKHQGKPLESIPKDYVAWLHSSGSFDRKENQDLKNAFEKLGKL
ncbi:MAG: putative quorum-sensing-regulated virulence factor [Chlamydiales bacterium]